MDPIIKIVEHIPDGFLDVSGGCSWELLPEALRQQFPGVSFVHCGCDTGVESE